jgi:imidazolonepropionase-like amidohydrolase
MIAIKNAKLIKTITNGDIKTGTILIDNGKIKAVGTDVEIPDGTQVINASKYIVTPGLIDVHTHLGVFTEGHGPAGVDGNEMTNPATPQVRALDGLYPFDQGFMDAVKAGVTSSQVLPGSANVIGGEMVAVKHVGRSVEEMVIKSPSAMKVAFGENPKRVYGGKGKMPSTRMGVAAVLREQLVKAENYLKKLEKGAQDPDKMPERDLGLEALVRVLKREIPMRAHAHRADDILTAIRIAEEFNVDLTIEHCTEGHKIADIIAAKGVKVAVGPTMSSRSKLELKDKGWHTVVQLVKAGVHVSITTDHPVVAIDYLSVAAALAVRAGLTEQQAWETITINAARHIGIEDRVGSIEVGKDADIVLWSGDPLDPRTRVKYTLIDGKVVYQDK